MKLKNVQFSLKCLKILEEKGFENFTFTIIGAGNYRKNLENLAKKLGLQNKVYFTGIIHDKNILKRHYANADLLLFPSFFDNDSLVILEAACMGVPTLALKNFGCGERIIDGETGFLAELDEQKFATKMFEIATSQSAYQKVKNNLETLRGDSWMDISKQYVEVFENAMLAKSLEKSAKSVKIVDKKLRV